MVSRGEVQSLNTNSQQKPYDGTLKGLFGEQAAWIIPYLLPAVKLQGDSWDAEHNIEINRSTLQVDLLYKALYRQDHVR